MIEQENKIYQCDECKEYFEVKPLDIIDVVDNPDKRKEFILGTIYRTECPFCHEEHFVLRKTVIIDRNNKFILVAGTLYDCFSAFEDENKNIYNNYLRAYDENDSIEDYTLFSSSDYAEAVTSLVALENKLDVKVVNFILYSFIDLVFKNENIKVDKKEVSVLLTYNDKNELIVCCDFMYQGELKEHTFSFGMELYNNFINLNCPSIDRLYPYYFTLESVRKYHSLNKNLIEKMEKITKTIAIVSSNGKEFFVGFNKLKNNKIQEGDEILINYDKKMVKGTILKLLKFNVFESPIDLDGVDYMVWKYQDIELKVGKTLKSFGNNSETAKKIIKELQNDKFPSKELKNCDVIVGKVLPVTVFYSDSMFEPFDNEDDIVDLAYEVETTIINNKKLICVYLSKDSIYKKKCATKYIARSVNKFNDIARFAVMNSFNYDGILLIYKGQQFIISNKKLILTYIPEKVMNDNDEMRKFLESLNEKEINYLEKETYDFILEMYSTDKGLNKLREEYNLNEEEAGKLLDKGYKKIKSILIIKEFEEKRYIS